MLKHLFMISFPLLIFNLFSCGGGGTSQNDKDKDDCCNSGNAKKWSIIIRSPSTQLQDKMVGGFYAYDMLTKYYHYDKKHLRFLSPLDQTAKKWANLEGIQVFDHYQATKTPSSLQDIYALPNKKNVEAAFLWLQTNTTQEDKVFIYIEAHGSSGQKGTDYDQDIDEILWEDLSIMRGDDGEVLNFDGDGFSRVKNEGFDISRFFPWLVVILGAGASGFLYFFWRKQEKKRPEASVNFK